jgi:hypothetical protein
LKKFIKSVRDNAENWQDHIYFTFLVDEDDRPTQRYLKYWQRYNNVAVLTNKVKMPDELPHLAKMYNQCYNETPFKGEDICVSMFGDDMVVDTPDFDKIILGRINLRKGWAVVYGDDDYIQHGKMCVHLVTTRQVVQATQRKFMCELFRADAIDTVWYLVAKRTGMLEYIPDLHIRHEHNGQLSPAVRDETFKRLRQVVMPFAQRKKALDNHVNFIVSQVNKVKPE